MTRPTLIAAALAVVATLGPAAAQDGTPLIAQACAGCHGQDGAGMGPVPVIAGKDRDAFVEVWSAFRADAVPATIMNRIAKGYTDDEVAILADYFASLR